MNANVGKQIKGGIIEIFSCYHSIDNFPNEYERWFILSHSKTNLFLVWKLVLHFFYSVGIACERSIQWFIIWFKEDASKLHDEMTKWVCYQIENKECM